MCEDWEDDGYMVIMHEKSKKSVDITHNAVSTLCTALLLLLQSASAASAATITVDDSGGADYTSIQAAVDNASGGYVSDKGVGDCTYFARAIARIAWYSA